MKNNETNSPFFNLISDQFTYGGQKYAYGKGKESTDILFDTFGKNWLLGTMTKYCFRYTNLKRERDLLKTACYCYILWLKRGFYYSTEGLNKVQDTNVNLKNNNFILFKNQYDKFKENNEVTWKFTALYDVLSILAEVEFNKINEFIIFSILRMIEYNWEKEYKSKTTHDTDTNNEQNKTS